MLNLSRQERIRQRYKAMKPGYRPALEIYKEMIDSLVTPETRLLDAGCGPAGLVKEYVGAARLVVGVDRYVTSWKEPAEIRSLAEAELGALPFAANTVDLMTCSWVLEHLEKPLAVFREVARVLKPGGHFLFITPNKLNYAVWMRRLVPSAVSQRVVHAIYGRNEDFINPTFYRANSAGDLSRALSAAGLTCRRLEHIGDPSYLAVNEVAFRAAVLVEEAIDRLWPQSRVHLVGLYEKP